jgi:energy-coupling factor transporter transmembrane protein EcfT
MVKLLILQVIAHVMSDYFFQTDASSKEKNENGFKSKFLLKHALITFICAWVLSFDINFFFCALAISILHYIIDGLKKSLNTSRFAFFIDQILHLIVIVFFVWLFNRYFESNTIWNVPLSIKWLAIILGYLICIKQLTFLSEKLLLLVKLKHFRPF